MIKVKLENIIKNRAYAIKIRNDDEKNRLIQMLDKRGITHQLYTTKIESNAGLDYWVWNNCFITASWALIHNITTIPLDAVDDIDTAVNKTLEDLGYIVSFKDDTRIIYFGTIVSVDLNTVGHSHYSRNSEIIFVKIHNNNAWCYQTQSKITFDVELAAACLNKLHELNTKTK